MLELREERNENEEGEAEDVDGDQKEEDNNSRYPLERAMGILKGNIEGAHENSTKTLCV